MKPLLITVLAVKKHFEEKAAPLTVELIVEGAKTLAKTLLGV